MAITQKLTTFAFTFRLLEKIRMFFMVKRKKIKKAI
jgi:hypothetical protein